MTRTKRAVLFLGIGLAILACSGDREGPSPVKEEILINKEAPPQIPMKEPILLRVDSTCQLQVWEEPGLVVRARYLLKVCGANPPSFVCDPDFDSPTCSAIPFPEDGYAATIVGSPGEHIVFVYSAAGGGVERITIVIPPSGS